MSRVCELTGKKAMVGNNVSHALNRTKRKFDANLLKKRFYIPEFYFLLSLPLLKCLFF